MLRRAEKAYLVGRAYGFRSRKFEARFSNGVGRVCKLPMSRDTYERLCASQRSEAFLIARSGERNYWYFRDKFYWENEGLTDEQVTALLIDRERRLSRQIERAIQRNANQVVETESKRPPIPDDVKMFVWQRDAGQCVRCGSNERLEFDHIIPITMGGSNTARNLQLLCEECNRHKGGNLA